MVMRSEVTRRLFRDWAMVAASVTPDVAPQIDAAIDACDHAPVMAVEHLSLLIEHQPC
jgi:hypothetical protein